MFELRLIDQKRFRAVLEALEAAEAGDRQRLAEMVQEAQQVLEGPGFLRWHQRPADTVATEWQPLLARPLTQELLEDLSRALIPLLCMPEYQDALRPGDDVSPNFVMLGNADGGLYGALRGADTAFRNLFIDRFERAYAKYSAGYRMILLGREDLEVMKKAVSRDDLALTNEVAQKARGRLLHLVKESLRGSDTAVAVSMEDGD